MEIEGDIYFIGETEHVTDSFQKRVLVIKHDADPQYPQLINFEFCQKNVELLNSIAHGQRVMVHFDLRGREHVNQQGVRRFFNTLQGWRVTPLGPMPAPQPQQQAPMQAQAPQMQPQPQPAAQWPAQPQQQGPAPQVPNGFNF